MKKVNKQPPGIFLKFFRWYCDPEVQDYIEGDLMEVYHQRLRASNKRAADMRFIIDVLLLFRPGIVRSLVLYRRSLTPIGMYKNYLKTGWRNLVRNKGYAAINIAGLTLSITCGIFIFSFVTYHLSFDNFHEHPDRTYRIVTELHREEVSYSNAVPSPLGEKLRSDYALAESIARAYTDDEVLLSTRRGNDMLKFRERDLLAFAEPVFFDIFNFPLHHGSLADFNDPTTAAITERMARKYFGDGDPIGEVIWLENKHMFTVKAVLKDLPENTDLKAEIFVPWSALKQIDTWLSDDTRGWGGIRSGVNCYMRLNPGVSAAEAEQVMQPYPAKYRPNNKNVHRYKLQPIRDMHFDARYSGVMPKGKLWALSIIGLLLVVTACVNFVNLATAQALKRSKEIGVRKVLGGLKRQLFGQFIFETAMITFLAIMLSLVLASATVPYLGTFFGTHIPLPVFSDWHLAGFALALGVVITFLAGYYPGLVLAGFQPITALKGKLSQRSIGGFNLRRTLIVAQFTLSQVLIIGMVVVMEQMRFAQQSDLGFEQEGVVMVLMGNDSTGTKSNTLKHEFSRIPAVEDVSLCFAAPASLDDWGNAVRFDNDTEETNFRTSIKSADEDYIATFGLELAAGRNLQPADTAREILVNEALTRKLGLQSPDEALGKMISANGGSIKGPVVGVIKDFHDRSFHQDISAILVTTNRWHYMQYAIRLNMRDLRPTMAQIEQTWLQHHPNEVFQYQFVDDSIAGFYQTEESTFRLIQFFSMVAILIGSLGLYGLVSFMVVQKTKEVGVRKILGASVTNIAGVFGREFAYLILIAFAMAAPIGWWVMHGWLQDYKFQIQINAWTFIPALACSFIIAAMTVSYQVVKASFANPVNSLRTE